MFMASESNLEDNKLTWLIDNGYTGHMAKEETLFTQLDRTFKTYVKLGDCKRVRAEGKGSVSIQTKQGTKFISDVLFVPSLDQNLLSVAQMKRKHYSVIF